MIGRIKVWFPDAYSAGAYGFLGLVCLANYASGSSVARDYFTSGIGFVPTNTISDIDAYSCGTLLAYGFSDCGGVVTAGGFPRALASAITADRSVPQISTPVRNCGPAVPPPPPKRPVMISGYAPILSTVMVSNVLPVPSPTRLRDAFSSFANRAASRSIHWDAMSTLWPANGRIAVSIVSLCFSSKYRGWMTPSNSWARSFRRAISACLRRSIESCTVCSFRLFHHARKLYTASPTTPIPTMIAKKIAQRSILSNKVSSAAFFESNDSSVSGIVTENEDYSWLVFFGVAVIILGLVSMIFPIMLLADHIHRKKRFPAMNLTKR